MADRNLILFRTQLFQYEQPDDQLDTWIVGRDCASSLYARMVPHPNLIGVTEPVMEDWGWYARVKTRDIGVSIQVLVYSWPFLDNCWMIGLETQQAFFGRHSPEAMSKAIDCASDVIDGIVRSDSQFESFGWSDANPLESEVTAPRTSYVGTFRSDRDTVE